MNNRRRLYYPAVAYASLLLLVWLLSWVVDIAELLTGGGDVVSSLLSAEGVRWAVRGASLSLTSAPWGVIVSGVSLAGLVMGAGVTKSIRALSVGKVLMPNERRAWLFAFVTALVFGALLLLGTLAPWSVLLGVTGNFNASPLMQGAVFLFFAGGVLVFSVYGFIYGNYRSVVDVALSMGEGFSFFAPALLAVLPATGILPCVEFSGLFSMVGVSVEELAVVADVMYLLPFLFVLLMHYAEGKR